MLETILNTIKSYQASRAAALEAAASKLTESESHTQPAPEQAQQSTLSTSTAPTETKPIEFAVPQAPASAAMTLEQWRQMSAARPEMSMLSKPLTEEEQKARKDRLKPDSQKLIGQGGGFKRADGWLCQSGKCYELRVENPKSAERCRRCGSMRRFDG